MWDRDHKFDDDEPRGPPNGEPQGNPNGSPYRTRRPPKSAHNPPTRGWQSVQAERPTRHGIGNPPWLTIPYPPTFQKRTHKKESPGLGG